MKTGRSGWRDFIRSMCCRESRIYIWKSLMFIRSPSLWPWPTGQERQKPAAVPEYLPSVVFAHRRQVFKTSTELILLHHFVLFINLSSASRTLPPSGRVSKPPERCRTGETWMKWSEEPGDYPLIFGCPSRSCGNSFNSFSFQIYTLPNCPATVLYNDDAVCY